jgi:hypothetical protein
MEETWFGIKLRALTCGRSHARAPIECKLFAKDSPHKLSNRTQLSELQMPDWISSDLPNVCATGNSPQIEPASSIGAFLAQGPSVRRKLA